MKYACNHAGMKNFKYCATLSINPPSINLALVSTTLGIEPSEALRGGEKRLRNPERTYEWSVFDGDSVADFLHRMGTQLSPHHEFLRKIHSEGAQSQSSVGVFVDRLFDQIYPHVFLRQLAELYIELRLDQYPAENRTIKYSGNHFDA